VESQVDKKQYLSNFSIEAIWEELDRIKSHKKKVDFNYQRVMNQLKSPDLAAQKYPRAHK